MLAYIGGDDGLGQPSSGFRFAPDVVDHVRGVEVAIVGQVDDVADGGIALEFTDVTEPITALTMFETGQKLFEDFAAKHAGSFRGIDG